MKVRNLWLPALLLGCTGTAALILDTVYNVGGSGFFLSSEVCAAVFVVSLLLLIVIGYVLSAASSKYAVKSSTPGRSIFAGVFGFIASVSLIGTAVINILSFGSTQSSLITAITIMIYMFGGVVLLYEACISFTGHNGMVKRPLLSLAPVLWVTGRLIIMLLNYQRISLHAAVKYDVISTALLTMFLYYQAMYLSQPDKAVAVRRTTLYGIIYIAASVAVCGDIIVKMVMPMISANYSSTVVVEPTISRILAITGDLALAAYAGFFIHSMHKNTVLTEIEEEEEKDPDTEFLGSLSTMTEEETTEENKEAEGIKTDTEPETVEETTPEPEKEPEPVEETTPEPEKEPEPVVETTPEPEKEPEPVVETTPEPENEPEPVVEITPEPEKEPEPVVETTPEPEKEPEPVVETTPEPVKAPEPAFTSAPKAAEKTTDLFEELKQHAAEDEQKELDEMFSGDDDDYSEIFRILDEMSDE